MRRLVTLSELSPGPLCEWVARAQWISVPSPSLSLFHHIMGIRALPSQTLGRSRVCAPEGLPHCRGLSSAGTHVRIIRSCRDPVDFILFYFFP